MWRLQFGATSQWTIRGSKDGNKSFPIHSNGAEPWQQVDLGLTPYFGSQNKSTYFSKDLNPTKHLLKPHNYQKSINKKNWKINIYVEITQHTFKQLMGQNKKLQEN